MIEVRFRKGDLVRFRLGVRFVEGTIKEDRGPLGIKGRHLYLVKFRLTTEDETLSDVELPACEMELVSETARAK